MHRQCCIENGILHERKTLTNGERFLPWLHLKCARLWVPHDGLVDRDNDLELGGLLVVIVSSIFSSRLVGGMGSDSMG